MTVFNRKDLKKLIDNRDSLYGELDKAFVGNPEDCYSIMHKIQKVKQAIVLLDNYLNSYKPINNKEKKLIKMLIS